MVLKRGHSGGTARGLETKGVVLNARHGDEVVVVVEIRHEEKAACRPHIDGRGSGGGIVLSETGAILPWDRIGFRAGMLGD
jgi:hypothetical protein